MKRKMFIAAMVVLICLLGFGVGGCESDAQTGALVGTGAGAILGQIIGGDTEATLIGAAIGGAGGYMLGNESDKKKEKRQRQAQIDSLRQEMNAVFVNITNSNNSIGQVRLMKQGVGYIGPRGEYYNYLPTAAELEPIYAF